MEIRTYLSHSYRLSDQPANEAIWQRLAAKSFAFFVDPPSSAHQTAHLERQMLESACFVAVVPFRSDAPDFHSSPFILYEIGLAIQAKRPKLIFVDDRIGIDVPLFSDLDEAERIRFDPGNVAAMAADIGTKLDRLRDRALPQASVARSPSRRIGLVVNGDAAESGAAGLAIRDACKVHSLTLRPIDLHPTHNALLFQEIDSCDAVILDCRHAALPDWLTACLLVRPVPTVKLVHLREDEAVTGVDLHPMIAGTRMDALEPVPEHLLFWRFQEDLLDQLIDVLGKVNGPAPCLVEAQRGLAYFRSIGRRKAKIFVSNSGAQREFAATFVQALTESNLDYFHYKVDVDAGELWQKRLRQELADCDGLIAFIDDAYLKSEWSRNELAAALKRRKKEQEKFFFQAYNIGNVKASAIGEVLGDYNAKDLDTGDGNARDSIIAALDTWLKRDGEAGRRKRRSLIPGGTRELLLDVIRHLPQDALARTCDQVGLSAADLEMVLVTAADKQKALLSRRSARQILEALHRDDTPLAAAMANEHPLVTFCERMSGTSSGAWDEEIGILNARLRQITLDD